MKLVLRNFRCHTDAQYELPDTGLVLLAGDSGAGKSSLIKAILYSLYGLKAIKKPYTFGASTCSVTLEFMGLKIQRTNRPNRLLVNDDLEDEVAQRFIEEKLGMNYDEFLISSYIPQKNNTSILSLAPTEQLRLIKILAFEGDQNVVYKNKLAGMVKESSDSLTQKQTQLQFIQQELDRLSSVNPQIEFPLTRTDDETEDECVEEYRRRTRAFTSVLTSFLEQGQVCTRELNEYKQWTADLNSETEKLKQLKEKIASLDEEIQILNSAVQELPSDLDAQIKLVADKISYLELQGLWERTRIEYISLEEDEARERDEQKAQIEHVLWRFKGREKTELSAVTELEGKRQEFEEWNLYQKELAKLNQIKIECENMCDSTKNTAEMIDWAITKSKLLETERKELYAKREQFVIDAQRLEFEKQLLYCPECSAALQWQDHTLVTVHDHVQVADRDYNAEISEINAKLEEIEAQTPRMAKILEQLERIKVPELSNIDPEYYANILQEIQRLEKYITQNKNRERDLAEINKRTESAGLRKLRKRVAELQEELNKSPHLAIDHDTIEELRERMQDLKLQSARYADKMDQLYKITAEHKKITKQSKDTSTKIRGLKTTLGGLNIDAIKKRFTQIEKDIAKAKAKQAEDEELSEKVDAYLLYREKKKELDHWGSQLDTILAQTKKAEKVHTAHLTLREKYNQAEIMAVESTVDSINEHTQYYLDTFFSEHQLSVLMRSAYKGKIQTLKIDNFISYKGNEYDSLSQMSGGEFDRCTLASVCGINNMLGSPILMLDESLASLDADINTEIISFLRELAQNKLILVCSHEAVRGIFDTIVNV